MRGVALKIVAGAAVLAIGGGGVFLGMRSRQDSAPSMANARAGLSQRERQWTVLPGSVPGQTPRLPAAAIPAPRQAPAPADPFDSMTAAPRPVPHSRGQQPLVATAPARRPQSALTAGGAAGFRADPIQGARPGRLSGSRSAVTISPVPARRAESVSGASPGSFAAAPGIGAITSPGGLDFTEEPAEQRVPVLILENGENGPMRITLRGAKKYQRSLGPRGILQFTVSPGEYAVQVRSTARAMLPGGRPGPTVMGQGKGQGVFREYHRYYARLSTVALGKGSPIRLGELSREPAGEEPEAPVIPVPEGE